MLPKVLGKPVARRLDDSLTFATILTPIIVPQLYEITLRVEYVAADVKG